ncbi:MAG: hypothetical protein M1832_005834 [Thelocarpon impressellum]|nr:MAG: hypothetical protein M1832_005834 [Thelocarpon impressellum]
MPRAEVGSTKFLNNKLKSKGLQRLRWYCQVCERQMRDENGFKCHTQSESHVRQMLLVGEDPRKAINDYSAQFQRDFLQLLRTSHGEKKVNVNHFYNEYIANKEHVHMNATRWPSLTEYAKHLGREGICRVEEAERGLTVAWIDNSPEALRRQDAIRKKERQDRGDEEREQRLIREQVARANTDAELKARGEDGDPTGEAKALQRSGEGEKIKLTFGPKPKDAPETTITPPTDPPSSSSSTTPPESSTAKTALKPTPTLQKPKNVFAGGPKKKHPLLGDKKAGGSAAVDKPMSEAERIMRAEIEQRKRVGEGGGGQGMGVKRQKVV